MRICFFTPNFLPSVGGVERMLDIIIRGLLQKNHEIQVLAQQTHQPMPQLPYPVHHYKRPWAQHLHPESLSRAVIKMHRKWPFDLMMAIYSYPTGFAAARVKKQLGFKLIVNGHGGDLYPNYHGLKKWRVPQIIRQGYCQADHVAVVSQWLAERVRQIGQGLTLPPIHVIPNGIDMAEHDRLLNDAKKQPQIAKTLGLNDKFMLHLGRVAPVKCVDLAVKAVSQIAEVFRKHGWQYAIVGDGQDLPMIRQRVADQNLEDVIKVLGTRSGLEKYWLLAHAQCMVSSSREEGLPVVLVETLASSLPSVCSDIGPHREVLANTQAGLLFNHPNVDDLADKLKIILQQDLTPMRQAAFERRNEFALAQMMDRYHELCEQAVKS